MNASLDFPQVRQEELRKFFAYSIMFLSVMFLLLAPEFAHAQFDGSFGPNQDMVRNADASLKDWWKAVAAWGMWIAVAAFLFSILFAGGKWWYIPIIFFVVCLFGEPAITQIRTWSGMTTNSATP